MLPQLGFEASVLLEQGDLRPGNAVNGVAEVEGEPELLGVVTENWHDYSEVFSIPVDLLRREPAQLVDDEVRNEERLYDVR